MVFCSYPIIRKGNRVFKQTLSRFTVEYPGQIQRILKLKARLCALVHKEVDDFVLNTNLSAERKMQQFNAIPCDACEASHKAYLDRLIEKARDVTSAPGPLTMWNYEQAWRSLPPLVVPLKAIGPPTAHKVTIHSVRFKLSQSYYDKLHGTHHANPRVEFHAVGNTPSERYGPEYDDKTDFTVNGPLTFYCDSSNGIKIYLKDHDDRDRFHGVLAPVLYADYGTAHFAKPDLGQCAECPPSTFPDGTEWIIRFTRE